MRLPPNHAALLRDALFSIYSASLMVVRMANGEGSRLLFWLLRPVLAVYRLLHPSLHTLPGMASIALPFLLAVCLLLACSIFALLCLLRRVAPLRGPSCLAVGGLTVAAPLYFDYLNPSLDIAQWVPWLETAAMVGCVLFFWYRGQRRPWAWLLLAVLHFGMWGVIVLGPNWREYLWMPVYLWSEVYFAVLPFFTSLAWGASLTPPPNSAAR